MRVSSLPQIVRRLSKWYNQSRRANLPWRGARDPYRIWISELMLQQTRVDQAIPYYKKFIDQFPTLQSLAMARRERVLKMWEGLGYYRRAKYAHDAANLIVNHHNGRLPANHKILLSLPGFGDYTASAVMSIAFEHAFPAIDANVIRVLSRVLRIVDEPGKSGVIKKMKDFVVELMKREKPSVVTQALMELGALVCRPRRPSCEQCPLARHCRAFKEMPTPDLLPIRKASKVKPHHRLVAGILRSKNKILLCQRSPEGLLGGFWEFPGGRQYDKTSANAACQRRFKNATGISVRINKKLVTIHHEFTHRRLTVHFYTVARRSGRIRRRRVKWISPSQFGEYPISLITKKAMAAAKIL